MAKPNQSPELRAQQKAEFIKYFEDVPVQKYAAMFVGITEQTAIDWMKKDKDFLNDVNQARAKWVKKKATKAKAEFALERLEHEIFKQRTDVTSGDEPMKGATITFRDDPRPKT